jgi:hypothetical protein
MTRGDLAAARWWEIRRAQNLKPTTYRCPLCGQRLPALSQHLLMLPEGRPEGRRHAHTDCVMKARRAGRLPTREEFRAAHPEAAPPSRWREAIGRVRRRWRASSDSD